MDNILLAQELAFPIDNKVRGSNDIIKLDMQKAYDRVLWPFWEKKLAFFGFAPSWIALVMNIVSACHYSLLVNGEAFGLIHANKGLRQGDPLSPALFILMSEYLSRSLNALFKANPQLYYKVSRGMPVSHLAYADDCIVFCNGCKNMCSNFVPFF